MVPDLELAKNAHIKPIEKIAKQLELTKEEWEPYGREIAKLSLDLLRRKKSKEGKIILVTSINPTPAGEGKSTVAIGLSQAFHQLGHQSIVTLREPSLGPVMGMKGGATGGGYAQVLPMEKINLHFTGDLHAITTAHNTLAAVIDHHLYTGNDLNIDPRKITWTRVLDMNDRALRKIVIGLGGEENGIPRETRFQITAASEMMAIFCLARDLNDLKHRLKQIVIGYTYEDEPVTVGDLGVEGALTLLLKEAFKPNLVQTIEQTPALIHGGPFANIAHGCNSVIATKIAQKLADYVITEAGFGADLGAEKFLNIKTVAGDFEPSAVVIVVTIDALKMHGMVKGKDKDMLALQRGTKNLAKHLETIENFGLPSVVAINRFHHDQKEEIDWIKNWCMDRGVAVTDTSVYQEGGKGGLLLAEKVLKAIKLETYFKHTYDREDTLNMKIQKIATKIYGARAIEFTSLAVQQLEQIRKYGWDHLPICIAKTQYSLSDDPSKRGRPKDFILKIRELSPCVGAGFIVVYAGNIQTMPGLPKHPLLEQITVNDEGEVFGLT